MKRLKFFTDLPLLAKEAIISLLVILLLTAVGWFWHVKNKNAELRSLTYEVSSLEEQLDDKDDELDELQEDYQNMLREYGEKVAQYRESAETYATAYQMSSNYNAASFASRLNAYSASSSNTGVVVLKPSSCDHFVVRTVSGYSIVEWMGGYDPDEGDVLVGDFNSYGTREFYSSSHSSSRLYIDDYMLGITSTLDKIKDKCD